MTIHFLTFAAAAAMPLAVSMAPGGAPPKDSPDGQKHAESVYDFTVKNIDGKEVSLGHCRGDVSLVVNVASLWGLTRSQYSGLESIYKRYKKRGFKLLAFPANNFGNQEPDSNAQIKTFCRSKVNVTFDLFAKVSVKGDDQCPLYRYLTNHPDEKIAGAVKWNFQKYLVGRDGKIIAKHGPRTAPDDKKLIAQIEEALAAEAPRADGPDSAG